MLSTTRQVANWVAETRYENLPIDVREAAKRIILDTTGCCMGALRSDLGLAAQRVASSQGGSSQATIIGSGIRTSALMAAYANGRLANILDFDETFKLLGHHANAAMAGALAACELAGRDGKRLIAAFAVGFEMGARIGYYMVPGHIVDEYGKAVFWNGIIGPAIAIYAAFAACAVALDLTSEEIAAGFGICAHYLPSKAPSWTRTADLPTIKYEDDGWIAQAGLMAALQAREGVTGLSNVFEGTDGLWSIVRPNGSPDALVDGLGERWSVPLTSYKFWPCCRWLHYSLTALQAVVRREHLVAEEIEEIRLLTFPQAQAAECFRVQEVGPNLVATSFNYPHAAAMLVLGVEPGPDWFNQSMIYSDRAGALRRKVFTGVEPASQEPKAWGLEEGVLKVPSRAVVRARGRTFEQTTDYALGDPWNGAPSFGAAELRAKFRAQARALAPISDRWHRRVERIMDDLLSLEQVESVGELLRLTDPMTGL